MRLYEYKLTRDSEGQFTGFIMSEEQYREFDDMFIGLCVLCGAERGCCEPDARQYRCEECGKNAAYGVQELMLMGCIDFDARLVE